MMPMGMPPGAPGAAATLYMMNYPPSSVVEEEIAWLDRSLQESMAAAAPEAFGSVLHHIVALRVRGGLPEAVRRIRSPLWDRALMKADVAVVNRLATYLFFSDCIPPSVLIVLKHMLMESDVHQLLRVCPALDAFDADRNPHALADAIASVVGDTHASHTGVSSHLDSGGLMLHAASLLQLHDSDGGLAGHKRARPEAADE